MNIEHFDPVECVLCDFEGDGPEAFNRHMAEVHQPADDEVTNGPASVQTRLDEARKQCRLALGALEANQEFGLCAEVAEAEGTLDDVLDAIELRWSYPDARLPRRVIFEPRSDGAWLRRESVWVRDGEWRQVGSDGRRLLEPVLETHDLDTTNDLEYLLSLAGEAMRDEQNFDSDYDRALWVVSEWCQEINVRPHLDDYETGENVPKGKQVGEHPRDGEVYDA